MSKKKCTEFVKIRPERGYGNDVCGVLDRHSSETFILHPRLGEMCFYNVHLYTDKDTIARTIEVRNEIGANIGVHRKRK